MLSMQAMPDSGGRMIQKVRGLKYSVYVLMIFTAFLLKSGERGDLAPPRMGCCACVHAQHTSYYSWGYCSALLSLKILKIGEKSMLLALSNRRC